MYTAYVFCMRVKGTVSRPPMKVLCYIAREPLVYSFCFLHESKGDCPPPRQHWKNSASSRPWALSFEMKALFHNTRVAHVYSFYFVHESKEEYVPLPSDWLHSAKSRGKCMLSFSVSWIRTKSTLSLFRNNEGPLLHHELSASIHFLFSTRD
jgi:hypothetical protein